MSRKAEEMESSSEDDEAEEEEEEEDETASGSSEEEEFDAEDERVNIIPGETPGETPFQTAGDESSSASDEEDDAMKVLPMKPGDTAHLQNQQNAQTFDSDVESEYETESSSESEGLPQKPAKDKYMVQGSPTETAEALLSSQTKVQGARNRGRVEADDEHAKNGKSKAVKQQQKDPHPGKTEVLRNVQVESQSVRKGQAGVMRDIASDDSVRNDKKSGSLATKRKLAPSQHDAERDSADSAPTSKKKKKKKEDAEVVYNGKKSTTEDKAVHISSESAPVDSSKSKKGTDRDEPPHHTAKEIARKTLHSANARANGSQVEPDSKVLNAGHESIQEKKANASAITQRASASKQRRLPHVWSTDEEILMVSEVLNRVKMGLEVPSKRTDDFWCTLSEFLQEKLGLEFSKDQLCEKVRRLKQRYQGTVQKIKDSQELKKPYNHKSSDEQSLFDLMSQIWGRAEMVILEGYQQVPSNEIRPDLTKSNQSPGGEGKAMNISSPKARSKAIGSKAEMAAHTGPDVGTDTNAVKAVSPKLDHVHVAKDDEGHVVINALADGTTSPTNDVHRLLQDKVQAMLHELQEWSKQNLEEWMKRTYALIEDSTRKVEDQVRRIAWMGTATGAGVPMRVCEAVDFPLLHGDQGIQKHWYELHLQELNLHVQRLDLMRRECELKQEQIKVQLQAKSEK